MFMHSSTLYNGGDTGNSYILFRISVVIITKRIFTKATLSEIISVSILESSFGFHIDASLTRRHAECARWNDFRSTFT